MISLDVKKKSSNWICTSTWFAFDLTEKLVEVNTTQSRVKKLLSLKKKIVKSTIQQFLEHSVEKYVKTRPRSKIFREINSVVTWFDGKNVDFTIKVVIAFYSTYFSTPCRVKALLSRNFCQNSVRVNSFPQFPHCILWKLRKFTLTEKIFRQIIL